MFKVGGDRSPFSIRVPLLPIRLSRSCPTEGLHGGAAADVLPVAQWAQAQAASAGPRAAAVHAHCASLSVCQCLPPVVACVVPVAAPL